MDITFSPKELTFARLPHLQVRMALPTKYHPRSLLPFDERVLSVSTSTWYFHSSIYSQEYFPMFQKNAFQWQPEIRGSQFLQHGDQDID